MTLYELIATLVAVLAVVISFVSLVRTRKFNDLQTQLTKLSTDLAQRQLTRLISDEPLMGQPRFAVRAVSISGLGDPRSPSYQVKVKLRVENGGEPVLESRAVNLVALKDGTYLANMRARVERTEHRKQPFDVAGEHILTLTPPVDLADSFLHINYVDHMGKDKIAQFRVLLEGGPCILPSHVFFNFHQVLTIVPATAWHFKPDA